MRRTGTHGGNDESDRRDDRSAHADGHFRAPDDLLKLGNQVCFALAVASRSVIALYRPVLEPLGLTHPQYLVMLALWEQSPRTVAAIGRELQLEPATLSPSSGMNAARYTRATTSAAPRAAFVMTAPP